MNQYRSPRNRCCTFVIGLLTFCIVYPATASGQTREPVQGRVILKSGGSLEGKISEAKNPENGRSYITVVKQDGSVITLDQSRLVRKVELLSSKDVAYRQLAANASSVEEHRAAMNWCLDQPSGRRHFKQQIESHALNVIGSEPDDEQARKVLGFVREDGAWIQKDQFFAQHGYTRQGTSWTPVRTVQIQARQEEVDDKVADRKESLRKWLRVARRDEATVDELSAALAEFSDQYALGSIEKAIQREKSPELRALLIEGISQVPSGSAMRKLVGLRHERSRRICSRASTDIAGAASLRRECCVRRVRRVFRQ